MIISIYVLIATFLVYLCRYMYLRFEGRNNDFLWVSFFMFCIPLTFEKVISFNDSKTVVSGTLGSSYKLGMAFFLSVLLLAILKFNINKLFTFKIISWVTVVSILVVVSILNPYNEDYQASVAFAIFFFTNILLFKIIASFIDGKQLLLGFYDGFVYLCICQFVLAICFPLLNITRVAEMFHEGGLEGATRIGSRVGAIGTFVHPGSLAIFTIWASSFFMACYQYGFKKKGSFFLMIINTFTIILTFSRTSYITYAVILMLLVFVKKNKGTRAFQLGNILKILLPITIVVGWTVFLSPFSDVFLKSDAGDQYLNRTVHYIMALNMFKVSPIIGVGLNAHLSYLSHHPFILSSVYPTNEQAKFFRSNPVHNIHLIVLCETGIIGFAFWAYFLLNNIYQSAKEIFNNRNQILSLAFIGVIFSISFYGATGWSPFSSALLPFFLMFSFFTTKAQTTT